MDEIKKGANLEAIFFDLDGTLIDISFDDFLPLYFEALNKSFSSLFSPDFLVKSIMRATEKMVVNDDPKLTNKKVFWKEFDSAGMVDASFESLAFGSKQFIDALFGIFDITGIGDCLIDIRG